MWQLLAVGTGGFCGAIARYALTGFIQRKLPGVFPWGTLAVNAVGCLAIGALMVLLLADREHIPEAWRALLVTGFLGSLTTFSTFGYETVELLREEEYRLAGLNVAANVCVGCAFVWLGAAAANACRQ